MKRNVHEIFEEYKIHLEEGKSVREALELLGKKLNISAGGVKKMFQRTKLKLPKKHTKLLTDEEEKAVVYACCMYARAEQPLTSSDVIGLVKDVFEANPSEHWVRDFLARHQDRIKLYKMKDLADYRAKNIITQQVEHFITKMDQLFNGPIKISGKNLINYDETRLGGEHGKKSSKTHIGERGIGRNNMNTTRKTRGASMMPFINADGEILAIFYIVSSNGSDDENAATKFELFKDKNKHFTRTKIFEEYFVYTKTGYLNGKAFDVILKKFLDVWELRYPGLQAFILGDNSGTHLGIETLKYAMKKNHHMIFFPPNTTHIIQPLDSNPFGVFKKNLYRALETHESIRRRAQRKAMANTVYISQVEVRKYINESTIKSGFKNCGIWPWNPDLVLKLANKKKIVHENPEETKIMENVEKLFSAMHDNDINHMEQVESSLVSGNIKISRNYAFSVDDHIKIHEEKQKKQRIAIETKEKNKQEKLDKKRKREEAIEDKKKEKERMKIKKQNEAARRQKTKTKPKKECMTCHEELFPGHCNEICNVCKKVYLCTLCECDDELLFSFLEHCEFCK